MPHCPHLRAPDGFRALGGMTTRFLLALVVLGALPALAGAQTLPQPSERLPLDTAIRLALAHNRQVQAARLETASADDAIAIARSRRLPSFSIEGSASQLLSPVSFSFPKGAFGDFATIGPVPAVDTTVDVPRRPTAYVSSSVSQPLTQLVKINVGVRNAVVSRDLQTEQVRSAELSVVNSVTRLYASILQTQSALEATRVALALYAELDRTVQVRVAQQVALRSDALDVQFRIAQEQLTETTVLNTLASQKEQMNQLLGRDVRTAFEVESLAVASAVDVDLTAAQQHALDRRPDVRRARLVVRQAELDRAVTRAGRLPEVSAAVSYTSNVNIDMLPANLASAGVQVTWEPFDWGRRGRELASKGRAIEQATLALREAEARAVIEVNARFRTLAEKRALLRVTELAQATGRERMRVKTNQYQLQAALLPDVLQLRSELAATDDRYQQALSAFWSAKADFALAIGEDR
jgi:outer membrane protein